MLQFMKNNSTKLKSNGMENCNLIIQLFNCKIVYLFQLFLVIIYFFYELYKIDFTNKCS